MSLLSVPVQACVFVLGCALIHAARARAATLTRWLAGTATILAALTVIAAAAFWAPAPQGRYGEISVYAAIAGEPPEAD